MKVFLANPPWRKGKLYGIRAGSRWPFMTLPEEGKKIPGYMPFPFFLAYAAAVLEKNKITAGLVDALAEGLSDSEFISKVKDFAPGLLLLETSTPSINVDLEWAEKIKEIFPYCTVCLAGSHANVFSEKILAENSFVDCILKGEYEYTLLEITRKIEAGQGLAGVKGIVFRQGAEIIKNPDRPLTANLDEFPWPARHFLPMDRYNDSFAGFPVPNVQVWASRGCPFKCIFCNWPTTMYGGHSYRTRNPKDVADEVEWLVKTYGFKGFYFDDDTFNIGKDRILELCGELKRKNLNLPWAVMARADTSDAETLKAMKDAGLWAIKFGVESGSQKLVNDCGKNLDLNKVRQSVREAKQIGLKVHLTFTFGLPGETAETIKETMKFAREANPDSVQHSIVTPFPGTEYFGMLDKKGFILSKNWEDYDGNNRAVIRTEMLTAKDLENWRRRAANDWNWHIFRVQYLAHPLKSLLRVIEKPARFFRFFKRLFPD